MPPYGRAPGATLAVVVVLLVLGVAAAGYALFGRSAGTAKTKVEVQGHRGHDPTDAVEHDHRPHDHRPHHHEPHDHRTHHQGAVDEPARAGRGP